MAYPLGWSDWPDPSQPLVPVTALHLSTSFLPPTADVAFRNCEGTTGGAVYQEAGSLLTCTRCEFTGNKASGSGGAVYMKGGGAVVTLSEVVFEGNSATTGDGGALYVEGQGQPASVTLDRCLLLSNTAGGSGGGVVCTNCKTLEATSTILALNAASGGPGGGIWLGPSASVASMSKKLQSVTFVDNTAKAGTASSLFLDANPGTQVAATNSIFSGATPLIQWQAPSDFAISYSVWPGKPAVCSPCGLGMVDADPLLFRGAATLLPAGAVGPAAWWAPTAASPGNKKGDSATVTTTKDYLGNKRVCGQGLLASVEHTRSLHWG
jgi:predicted outer membrane repeat protein